MPNSSAADTVLAVFTSATRSSVFFKEERLLPGPDEDEDVGNKGALSPKRVSPWKKDL